MQPMDTAYTTRVFAPPANWDESKHGKCVPLAVIDTQQDGLPTIGSCWRLSWRERLLVLMGHPVYLGMHTTALPPLTLTVWRMPRAVRKRKPVAEA